MPEEKTSLYNERMNSMFHLLPSSEEDRISKQMSSKASDEDEFPSGNIETKQEQWQRSSESLKRKFLGLMRIRDFLSLIITYPMTISDQHLLRRWIDNAQALTAKYSEQIELFIKEEQSIDSLGGEEGFEAYPWMQLLFEKPLIYIEGLIDKDIESKIEDGQRSILNENGATLLEELVAPTSTSKGKQVLELANVNDLIPKTILNIAVDHAINQLIQTLLMCNIHHIRFLTRSDIETAAVMSKLKAALIDIQTWKKIDHKYSRVLWIEVSKHWSSAEAGIRHEIAQRLNIVMTGGDMTEDEYEILLTKCIEEEMTRMKHLVLLVDQVVNCSLDPRKMGFPRKTLASVVVLITTESSVQENDELTMAMDLEIRTEDHLLPWELFCQNVGIELVRSSSAIGEIAVQIVEECRGHLVAILVIAKSLKNVENVELWKVALDKLCYPSPSYDISRFHGMSRVMVCAFINFIWDSINDKLKHCLTHCLYVPGIKERVADHLLMSSWLYNELVCSLEEAEYILRDLAARSILLQLEGRSIRLPEETYDVLNSLLKLDLLEKIRQGGLGITGPTNAEEWHGAKQIEQTDDKLFELPPSPNCPELEVLLLLGNSNLTEIPPLFFCFMPQLLVLDLSYTSIRSFPSSFFDLKAIKRLHLRGCKCFKEMPPEIGQVKNLEILDLDGTPILYLPKEIQHLTKLQKLTLTFLIYHHQNIGLDMESGQYRGVISPGVLSKLTQLCYLSIDVIPSHDKLWDDNVQVILQEIFELQGLITLILYIPRVELLKCVPDYRYLDFRFVVGRHMQRIISLTPPAIELKFKQSGCSLKFVNGVNIPNEIIKVLGHTNTFFLERHMNIKYLSEFELKNLEQLRICIVGECNEMQTLIDGVSSYNCTLPYLEFLCLFHMNNLRSICQRKVLLHSCLCRLKTIALHNCSKLTTILTMDFLDNLSRLEELIVEDCPKVSTLISFELFESTERIFLPGLRKVSLLYLPELVSISSGLCIGPNLEKIGFYDCPKLQSLSTMELSSQSLKVIKAEKEWWNELKWEETEWGKGGRPEYLGEIFFTINEEGDIMDQLVRDDYESSRSKKSEILVENSEETSKDQQGTEYLPQEKVLNLDIKLDEQQPHSQSLPYKKVENSEETSKGQQGTEYLPQEKVLNIEIKSKGQQPHSQSLPHKKKMKRFFFKEKSNTRKESRSAPEFQNDRKKKNSEVNRVCKSTSSVPSPGNVTELYKEIVNEQGFKTFSLQELMDATNDFNERLKIGEGCSGTVYEGIIWPQGKQGDPIRVAIKILSTPAIQGHKEWLALREVQFLGNVNHPNLVKLLGYCYVDGEIRIKRLLVYEYMANGSLEYRLFNQTFLFLPWKTRLQIMLIAAQGLAYLHEGLEVQVIHGDFKTSNILMDEDFHPKLSDFGLARERPKGHYTHISTAVVGMLGYAAPEYIETGHLKVECDIYSFGVVLYEIITGKRAFDRNRPTKEQDLIEWVKNCPANTSRFSTIIDPLLLKQFPLDAVRKVAELADSCIKKNPQYRPTMSQVVESLKELA